MAGLGGPEIGVAAWEPDLGVTQRGTLQVEDVGGMDEAVADRVGEGRLPDDLMPRLEGELGGDEGRGALGPIL